MGVINLLHGSAKKPKRVEKKKPQISLTLPKDKSFFLWPVFGLIPLLLAVLGLLFILNIFKAKTLAGLEQKVANLKSSYKKIQNLSDSRKNLTNTLTFLQNISLAKTSWSDQLINLEKLIPNQIWLTNITLESIPEKQALSSSQGQINQIIFPTNKSLTIRGSATSVVESEIISSITRFADSLKKDKSFSRDFKDIKLGPLQSEKKGNLVIMNFSVYCKSEK